MAQNRNRRGFFQRSWDITKSLLSCKIPSFSNVQLLVFLLRGANKEQQQSWALGMSSIFPSEHPSSSHASVKDTACFTQIPSSAAAPTLQLLSFVGIVFAHIEFWGLPLPTWNFGKCPCPPGTFLPKGSPLPEGTLRPMAA